MNRTLKPLNILLVEDNPDHAELIQDALIDFNIGNTVVHVEHGEALVSHLGLSGEHSPAPLPDLILMDIKMPRLNGVDALKTVKAHHSCAHIPVVMVTTSSNEHEIETCYAAGAAGYVTKPLQFEKFADKMRELNFYWVVTSELPPAREARP